MKKFSFVFLIILVLGCICVCISACSTPPKEEMEKAQDAVTRAENDANAVIYASSTLVRARDALTRMQNEADSKRYDAAKTYAAEAVSQAERAIAEGKTSAERARDEAQNLINSLAVPLEETSAAIDAAWRAEKIRLDFAALQMDMEAARRTYDSARNSLQSNNYKDAVSQGQTVRSLLSGINASLTEGVQAVSRKQ